MQKVVHPPEGPWRNRCPTPPPRRGSSRTRTPTSSAGGLRGRPPETPGVPRPLGGAQEPEALPPSAGSAASRGPVSRDSLVKSARGWGVVVDGGTVLVGCIRRYMAVDHHASTELLTRRSKGINQTMQMKTSTAPSSQWVRSYLPFVKGVLWFCHGKGTLDHPPLFLYLAIATK